MITHNLNQGTPEWEAFRLTHFGASEAAAMLGISSKVTRNELLRMKSTGIAKEFSDWVQKNILDYGHEVEAKARPLAEKIIGEDLYPVTCSDGKISASCDGITLLENVAFEHKQFNAALAESVAAGVLPDEYMPQCQQVLMITRAEKLIFVCSDGTPENFFYMFVYPDEHWFSHLRAGWAQFEKDLNDYRPTEEKPAAIGVAPEMLPALRIEVSGAVTASNLADFKSHALKVFGSIKTDLDTDEDFANADKTTKWCKEVEDRLEAAKQHALSQTASIDELFRTVDAIKEEARKKRLTLEKLVKSRKESIRFEKIDDAKRKISDHISALQSEIHGVNLIITPPDFGGAIKGLKTLSSIQNALDAAVANAKISADAQAKDWSEKLDFFREHAAGYFLLFPDLQQIIVKPMEDFALTISSRIEQHKKAEADRLEADRERIRQEEAAKLAAKPAPATALQPITEVSQPVSQAPVQAVASIVARSAPALKLGALNARLGISVSADFLQDLGFPAHQSGASKLYHEQDFPRICQAISNHLLSLIGK